MRDESSIISLAHCQAWLLLSAFEAQNFWFTRASISCARAVRLSQILGLQTVDGVTLNQTLLEPRDWCEREERRRTMWTMFALDRGNSATATWPVLIDVDRIRTHLPSTELAYQNSVEEPSVPLSHALTYGLGGLSAFACRVVASHLFHECIDSGNKPMSEGLSDEIKATFFWGSFNHLNNSLATAFSTLPPHLSCPENTHDNNAVIISLELCAAMISLYRGTLGKPRHETTPLYNFNEKTLEPAQTIVTTVALAVDVNARFRSPLVAFAAFLAGFVYLKHYLETKDTASLHKLLALLDVMIAVRQENPGFPGSLAVQMARELESLGIDPMAMEKVRVLTERMGDDAPILGKEVGGTLVFCPVVVRKGPTGSTSGSNV